ncbi:hypothetical protein BFJ63_vAg8591 [Fusarium oxysporum f. sp. narcissi]|uniref:Uncharacterized protein n=2 Tax=Fusarium oxysporum TaxID=5507 RepID=A0A420U895_FUSOX|nr:hypothetical protein FOWG_08282 [Fusarium oxysporum f. sp. lycopersici MN25]KAF5258676.1 hypothetical protein FOXYS1_10737 [Fusarium oxysporum]KAH7481281.1 hypothetical protein FOMA001_g8769 [Fusarium oxysporum f. sp. matthiolae]RKL50021.1 hypothetical protein BFJ70_g1191 [Fusarium oxysporum]RYC88529.1 hypothetical protein BFJ63_vAg8591 [Fusarium oxysporum f. sp. narcissi]
MEKPTPNPEHHQHHAHHSLEHDNQQPSGYKSRDFGSPLEPELEEQDPQSVPIHTLQSLSAPVVCPKCGVRAMTITRLKSGSFALALAGIALITNCWLLVPLPFLMSSTKDVLHQCGNCKILIAEWHRRGRTEVLAYPEVNGAEDENKDEVEVEVKVEDKSRESHLL